MMWRRAWLWACVAGAVCVGAAGEASAQECGCDHTLGREVTVADGEALGVGPGQVVCVEAGERPFLRLQRFYGEAGRPIVIKNCGGQVVIRNTDRAYALVVEGESRHFRLTGTGAAGVEYGFKVSAPDVEPYPGVGVWLLGKSTNYEVDHIEIHDTGFAGLMAKTDPLCDGSADQDRFVQRDVKLHHLYIHDTRGEGMYIGSTQAAGHTITCEGQREVHQPHFLEGIEVYDSRIEDTGWDGAQIGMARAGCAFYRNRIHRVGGEGVQYQQQGLQLGTFSACEVYDNVITDGPVMGVFALGTGRTRIYNNVIARMGEDGIYANDNGHEAARGAPYVFWHNTIVDAGRRSLTVFGALTRGSGAANNLMVGGGAGLSAGNDVSGWAASHNLTSVSLEDAKLDATYAPLLGSPALGAGMLLADVVYDLRGQVRPDPPAVGAYELYVAPVEEMGVMEEMGVEDDMMAPRDMSNDLDAADMAYPDMWSPCQLCDDIYKPPPEPIEQGCGCGAASAPAQGAWWLIGVLGWLGWRRRRM